MSAQRFWHWQGQTLILRCHIQPRASCDQMVGEHGDRLRVRIKAVPAEGAANRNLQQFFAQEFGVATSAVSILSGQGSKLKTAAVDCPNRLPEHLGIERSPAATGKIA